MNILEIHKDITKFKGQEVSSLQDPTGIHTIQKTDYSQLFFDLYQKKQFYFIDTPLEYYDSAYFRGVIDFEDQVVLCTHYMLAKGKKVFDTCLHSFSQWMDRKSVMHLKLELANIPIIPCMMFSNPTYTDRLFESESYVVKRSHLDRGEGVYKVDQKTQIKELLNQFPNELLIVQPFIPNEGDVRVLVVGNQVIGGMLRKTIKSDDFRNNASQGGHVEKYEVTPEMAQIALDACKVLKYDIAGVDLIFDTAQNKWLIMEVNRSPQVEAFSMVHSLNIRELMLKFLVEKTYDAN